MDTYDNQFKLLISTSDEKLIKELLVEEVNKDTNRIELSDECFLVPLQSYEPSSHFTPTPEILEFTIAFISGVGANVLAAWIYDKLKNNKKNEAKIEGININLNDKESIELLIIRVTSNDKNAK